MPENVCRKIDASKEPTSDWEYIGAYPTRAVTSTAPGPVIGTADAIFIWRRKFRIKYECTCNGKTAEIWIDGNYEYHYEDVDDGAYPIVGVGAPIPLPMGEALSALADVLGANINVLQWWLNKDFVDAMKPADPAPDFEGSKQALVPPPYAECNGNKRIRLGDGGIVGWPEDGTVTHDTNRFIILECPNGTATVGAVALGSQMRRSESAARTAAIIMAQLIAIYKVEKAISKYRCAKPCDEMPATTITYEGEQIGFGPTKVDDNTWACIAYVPWSVKFTCGIRTGMLDGHGEHYAKDTFIASAEGYNEDLAKNALMQVAHEKAWEAGAQVLLDKHYNTAAQSIPYFRIGIDKVDFLEQEKMEGLEGYTAVAYVSWHLELEDTSHAQQQQVIKE